jgi:hypothetical protein
VAEFILSILVAAFTSLRSRSDIALEILALRQQVAVLKQKRSSSSAIQLSPSQIRTSGLPAYGSSRR